MTLPGGPELALSFLISSTIKATLLLGLTAGIAYALRSRSASVRHQVWALGIVSSLALPLLTLLLPSWHSSTLSKAASLLAPPRAVAERNTLQGLPSMMVDAVAGSSVSGQLVKLILLLWALGALFITLKLLGGLARLAWVSTRSRVVDKDDWTQSVLAVCRSLGLARPVRVLQSADVTAMPMTWGIVRPRILVPAGAMEWSADRRRAVLSHELAHIARHDWLVQICAELARSLYWFHPLVWFATASLRNESERACDDAVLNGGIDASDYANQLLDLARTLKSAHRGWSAALAIARPTNLERRFIAMLNPTLNRGGLSPGTRLLARIATLCLLLPLAALRLPGQNFSGKFTGTIFDASGAAIPNATIIMTNHKENTLPDVYRKVEMTTSNAEGNFIFKALPTGEYEMKVVKPGFKVYRASQIMLEPGRDLQLTARLEIGILTESVDVQAEGSAKAKPSAETGEKPKPGEEPRKALGRIMPTHLQFSRAAVNIVWQKLMVIGLVEPYDGFDLRRPERSRNPRESALAETWNSRKF